MSPYKVQRKSVQYYRKKWETLESFRDWLKPFPKDRTKAYCESCNEVIKASLDDLQNHSATKKHIDNLQKFKDFTFEADGNIVVDNGVDVEMEESDDDIKISDKWSNEAVSTLLLHLTSLWNEYRNGLRKKKDVMVQVAKLMQQDGYNYSSKACDSKFRAIKIQYYSILERVIMGGDITHKVHYYDDIHEMLSNDPETLCFIHEKKSQRVHEKKDIDISGSKYEIITYEEANWTNNATNLFLNLLLEFKDVFTGKEEDKKIPLWQSVSNHMNLEGYPVTDLQCKNKWKRMLEQSNEYEGDSVRNGSLPFWQFYSKVRNIINVVKIPDCETVKKTVNPRKRGRGRPRKEVLVKKQELTENEMSEDEETKNQNILNGDSILIRRIHRLRENTDIWERLNAVENHLDELSDFHAIQRQTNTFLAEILNELSMLATHLSPNFSARDGITLVLPQSDS